MMGRMGHVRDRWMVRNPETGRKVRGPRWGKGMRCGGERAFGFSSLDVPRATYWFQETWFVVRHDGQDRCRLLEASSLFRSLLQSLLLPVYSLR